MRHLKKIIAVSALTAVSSANADFITELNPFIGVDYYHVLMKGERNYGQIFPKNFPGATIYVGTKLHNCLGIEIGYDWSNQKSRKWALPSDSIFFSSVVRTHGISGTTKIRRTGGHLDILGYLPVADCFEIFGSLGYGWVQARIHTTLNVPATSGVTSSAISSLTDKGRGVLRVGLGGNYFLNDYVGVRIKLGWETTSRLRVQGNTNFSALGFSTKVWKDSITGAIGTFVKF